MKSGVALSKIERRKQGKALRDDCPRTAQAAWEPRSKSKEIVKLLEESDADRSNSAMAPIVWNIKRPNGVLRSRSRRQLRAGHLPKVTEQEAD
jgi:hypothetical protein